MGNWKRQQDELKEAKEREKVSKEVIAKYFLDISKLIFTAIVLGGLSPLITDMDIGLNWHIIIGGMVTTLIFGTLGYRFIKL